MSQKFINLVAKTQKKVPQYESQQSKRFVRKRSQQSDRSIDSKRSRQSNTQANTISKNAPQQIKGLKAHLDTIDYFSHLANSVLLSKQITPTKTRYSRGRTDRTPLQLKQHKISDFQNHALTAELQVRSKQLQVMGSECKLLRQNLQQQTEKRKKIQTQKKQLSNSLSQKAKQLQKLQIQNKKVLKQKQYLMKQIQFLQRINYDQKTRNFQSFRQKYLQKQVQQMRKILQTSKTENQNNLENQILRIKDQKYSIQTHFKALKLANQTLIKQMERFKMEDKGNVYHTDQYIRLRQKYKLCLDAYKNLKLEYCELQKQLNRSLSNIPQHILNSNSQLSIVLSESASQKSYTDKQNTQFKIPKKKLDAQINQTPQKKSLSPRNQEQSSISNNKKPISPKSKKMQANPTKQAASKVCQSNIQKCSNFPNSDLYRLKISLKQKQ